jgi:cell division protein YceG involved in septum cleavage
MIMAFACSFVGVAAALIVTQPANKAATVKVQFQVMQGDNTNSVAIRLQDDGLIRNSTVFKLLARSKGLDTKIEQGIFELSPSMTMDQIIQTLLHAPLQQVSITIPPGHRVTEYPNYFTLLPNFDTSNFIQVVKTGVLKDGTKLSSKYWFIPDKQPNTVYALEGYLFPDTYYFGTADTDEQVIERMLNGLGEHLCPGPDGNHPDAYIFDQAQCKAHAAQVGKTKNIFTEMEQHYNTTDDVKALYDTLILSSIVVREVKNVQDIPGVADVYYNRYVIMANGTNLTPGGDTIVAL